jgi:trk system potassium uptake protein TrkH
MQISYKSKRLENTIFAVNGLTAAAVAASFVVLFGFNKPLLPAPLLYTAQVVSLCIFIAEKIIRLFNAAFKAEFWRVHWYEVPLLLALGLALVGAGRWFGQDDPALIRHFAVGVYLVLQVVAKLCRTTVNLAASGRNPTRTLILSFLVLIASGAGLLMLPKASAAEERLTLPDALFTATSATCVTGLIVKDTGEDFSMMGKVVILSLIQLGGLGIVVFGAVFALLLGQALSLRESVAMQDLLSARTLGRLSGIITFIFVATILIEAVGAISIHGMWDDVPSWSGNTHPRWFCSVFHSISAFCNAGFSLFSTSFIKYNRSWGVYTVICPLITKEAPRRMQLQTKIVLSVSVLLIVTGMLAILAFERYASGSGSVEKHNAGLPDALFQSVTARTAGFNTVDISALSPSARFILILLMFIGGSPGSTAGGIKTVTLAVVIMTAFAALRKRQEVEMFRRSVRIVVVGRAITVTLLFAAVLFAATLALSITENGTDSAMSDVMFEAASALGTVGLSTGITPDLTDAGKYIIILVMLIGRLGPLTLLAALTFNLKPARFNYPEEAIIVG